jgi:hypothetical protein
VCINDPTPRHLPTPNIHGFHTAKQSLKPFPKQHDSHDTLMLDSNVYVYFSIIIRYPFFLARFTCEGVEFYDFILLIRSTPYRYDADFFNIGVPIGDAVDGDNRKSLLSRFRRISTWLMEKVPAY